MSEQKYRKSRMFEIGSKAAKSVFANMTGGYLCPLCTRCFENVEDLTEEHVPQKSVGGKVICLTCKDCNDTAGHQFEYMLKHDGLDEGRIGPNPLRAEWTIGGVTTRGTLAFKDGMLDLKNVPGMNDPQRAFEQDQSAKDLEKGDVIELSMSAKYSRRKADIAYLKSAYLALFAKFGYTLIRQQAYDLVRNQIFNPNESIIHGYRKIAEIEDLPEYAILLAKDPVAVFCKMKGNIVIMPACVSVGEELYSRNELGVAGDVLPESIIAKRVFSWPVSMEMLFDSRRESG